ncbi:acyltransferase [Egibacter rhizosphaerae]|uniref:Acyltransferase n=1 Tax=Egibacter rhizosphaerae TaxID=1670831 RepID=A0A411YC71_9ACTN|nr:acyltransferase [Egibacter rhizosphaerae]QBI18786.1 acyltransferase [Egibacter rhizosphaerae]
MLRRFDLAAERIAERTSTDRERYLDFLRVVAISLVVLGHWLVRVVTEQDGEMRSDYLLVAEPWTQWASWIFQVMPLFFIVGGVLNLRSWRRARERGTGAVAWTRTRARRLLRPLVPLLVLWLVLAAILRLAGRDDVLAFSTETAIIPAWFLAAYLLVTALTPVVADRGDHRVLVALVAAATVVDGLRFAEPAALAWVPEMGGEPLFATLNFVFVWVAVHQLGFRWCDGQVPQRGVSRAALVLGALVVLGGLVLAGYPRSMVQVPGEELSNSTPPTIALFALGVAQLGVALVARVPVEGWLERLRPWGAVALLGSRLMTVFLWHQTAMLTVSTVAVVFEPWPLAAEIDATWWATRPLWLAACVAVLVPLVAVFGRFERVGDAPRSTLPPRAAAVKTAAAVVVTSASLGWLIVGGLTDPEGPLRLPVGPLVALLVGMAALGVLGGRHTRRVLAALGSDRGASRRRVRAGPRDRSGEA